MRIVSIAAKEETYMSDPFNPQFTSVHVAPLSVERKAPLPSVPAKISIPITASPRTRVWVMPLVASVQVTPLFVLRKTPSQVPAKRDVPETARAYTLTSVNPLFTPVQLVPWSVERKTPPPPLEEVAVPAKRFVPMTAREVS